ncbi:MAG: GNAT family N-acetyltransferase [Clostridiales bacterium]|nr:GNAT family N-acetyltransferase [Clostridiales bacterium]
MIFLADETESFVFEEEWDTIIPLEFKKSNAGEMVVTAFPSVEPIAREFAALFADNPFSEEAYGWLKSALAPYMEKWGYEDDEQKRLHYCYAVDDPGKINTNAILPETDFIDHDPDFRIFGDSGEEEDIYYHGDGRLYVGVLKKGELVSYAATSARYDKTLPDRIAIEVETLPEYRNQGYDVSSMAALALFICQNGQGVEYTCPAEDEYGQSMAKSVGFSEIEKQYYYIGRKKTSGI